MTDNSNDDETRNNSDVNGHDHDTQQVIENEPPRPTEEPYAQDDEGDEADQMDQNTDDADEEDEEDEEDDDDGELLASTGNPSSARVVDLNENDDETEE